MSERGEEEGVRPMSDLKAAFLTYLAKSNKSSPSDAALTSPPPPPHNMNAREDSHMTSHSAIPFLDF